MKIASSTISMASQHALVEMERESESLKVWGQEAPAVSVTISDAAKQLAERQQQAVPATSNEEVAVSLELSDRDKQKIELLQSFIEALTGKRFKFVLPEKYRIEADSPVTLQIGVNGARPLQGWGLDYQHHIVRSEQETMSFGAEGVIKTSDGRTINIGLKLSMTRQFMSEQHISIKAGDALVDPLVVNFGAPTAQLTTNKIQFDIDSDGKLDQISFTGPGSGFLALDSSGDGKINDGSELFGPQSGNGFADLTKYDSDGNNWIDENDSIYDRLRIWTKDEQGNDRLFALGQKGIGAIYLGNVDTQFAMKDSTNTLQGQLGSTGIFLRENGTAGTIQHVDLAV